MSDTELQHAPKWVHSAGVVIRHLPAGRYRLMNWLPRRSSHPFWKRMATELGGFSFKCDLKDSIAREVCFTGRYEPQETALVQSLLAPEMTFVDVGANWGYYTLLGAHLVGHRGRVIGMEPDPRLFPILLENIKRNGLPNVDAVQVAAATQTGTLTLSGYDASGDNYGLSRIVSHAETNAMAFQVETRSVDELLDELGVGSVDLLKMDIEGAEDMALNGMTVGLVNHRYRRVLLELHPALLAERGLTSQGILDLMISNGYKGWWIDFSPGASRAAAYSSKIKVRDYLRPLDASITLDNWPHILWLAPDTELPT